MKIGTIRWKVIALKCKAFFCLLLSTSSVHNALKFSTFFLLCVTVKTKHDSTDIIIVYGDVEKEFVGHG